MPSKGQQAQNRQDKARETHKAGEQLTELVGRGERLLPELRAGVITDDWRRRAKEVYGLACAADPHFKEHAAIEQFEGGLRAKGLSGDEYRAALLARGYNLSPEDQVLSDICRTIWMTLAQVLRNKMIPSEILPKAAVAISGAVQSLKELQREPLTDILPAKNRTPPRLVWSIVLRTVLCVAVLAILEFIVGLCAWWWGAGENPWQKILNFWPIFGVVFAASLIGYRLLLGKERWRVVVFWKN